MLINKRLIPIVTELFIRGRKLNVYLLYIKQFYFALVKYENPKPKRTSIDRIDHSSNINIDFKNFMNLYEKYTTKPYFF